MNIERKDKAEIAFAGSVEPDQTNICVREQGEYIERFRYISISTLRLFICNYQQN